MEVKKKNISDCDVLMSQRQISLVLFLVVIMLLTLNTEEGYTSACVVCDSYAASRVSYCIILVHVIL